MSFDLVTDLIVVLGGSWLIQLLARTLWALLRGGPSAARFVRPEARLPENRGQVRVVVMLSAVMLAMLTFGVASSFADLLGVGVPVQPNFELALCAFFLAGVGIFAGWTTWNGLATGTFEGMGSGRHAQDCKRDQTPFSYWFLTAIFGGIFAGCAAACLIIIAVILGLVT